MEHYTCCICAIMKNEHAYLDEWIQHHLDLGISHIHLYEDRGSEPHDEICNKYEKVTLHKLIDSKYDFLEHTGNRKQVTLYNYFILEYHTIYDFCLFIDLDEFLFFKEGWNLEQLLSDTVTKEYQLLWWEVFGANGHITKQNKLKESYTTALTSLYEWGHCMPKVLMNFHKKLPLESVHLPIPPNVTKIDYDNKYKKAWINHYYTKSWEDWCYRFTNRGDLWPGNRQIWDFFQMNPDMEPLKNELMDIYFSNLEKNKDLKIVFYYSSKPSEEEWFGIDKPNSLMFDVLTYSISFHFAKLTGREVVLYTDNRSFKYLQHLDYDHVITIPEDYEANNGNICKPLLYALENNDLNTCYFSGDFFLGNDILLKYIERDNTTDVYVNNTFKPKRIRYWDDMVNIRDNTLAFLSPELISDNELDVDWSFLYFNNDDLKSEFIKKYKENLRKYENSKYEEWWKMYKQFNPDTKLFGNSLGALIHNKKYFSLGNIECYGNIDKQYMFKIDFFESKSIPSLRYDPNFKTTLLSLLKTLNTEAYNRTIQIIKVYV